MEDLAHILQKVQALDLDLVHALATIMDIAKGVILIQAVMNLHQGAHHHFLNLAHQKEHRQSTNQAKDRESTENLLLRLPRHHPRLLHLLNPARVLLQLTGKNEDPQSAKKEKKEKRRSTSTSPASERESRGRARPHALNLAPVQSIQHALIALIALIVQNIQSILHIRGRTLARILVRALDLILVLALARILRLRHARTRGRRLHRAQIAKARHQTNIGARINCG